MLPYIQSKQSTALQQDHAELRKTVQSHHRKHQILFEHAVPPRSWATSPTCPPPPPTLTPCLQRRAGLHWLALACNGFPACTTLEAYHRAGCAMLVPCIAVMQNAVQFWHLWHPSFFFDFHIACLILSPSSRKGTWLSPWRCFRRPHLEAAVISSTDSGNMNSLQTFQMFHMFQRDRTSFHESWGMQCSRYRCSFFTKLCDMHPYMYTFQPQTLSTGWTLWLLLVWGICMHFHGFA